MKGLVHHRILITIFPLKILLEFMFKELHHKCRILCHQAQMWSPSKSRKYFLEMIHCWFHQQQMMTRMIRVYVIDLLKCFIVLKYICQIYTFVHNWFSSNNIKSIIIILTYFILLFSLFASTLLRFFFSKILSFKEKLIFTALNIIDKKLSKIFICLGQKTQTTSFPIS